MRMDQHICSRRKQIGFVLTLDSAQAFNITRVAFSNAAGDLRRDACSLAAETDRIIR